MGLIFSALCLERLSPQGRSGSSWSDVEGRQLKEELCKDQRVKCEVALDVKKKSSEYRSIDNTQV
jgi:hypothetical protein